MSGSPAFGQGLMCVRRFPRKLEAAKRRLSFDRMRYWGVPPLVRILRIDERLYTCRVEVSVQPFRWRHDQP
jgi:hypothetical protein